MPTVKESTEDGTLEAMRLGLDTLRMQRDELDRKIRDCERFLRAPTKATYTALQLHSPINVTKPVKRRNHGGRKATIRPISMAGVREALYSDSHRKLYCRGEVVSLLLETGTPMLVNDVGKRIGRNVGMVNYAVRNAPRGLFTTEKEGKTCRIALTKTGEDLSRRALAIRENV